MHGAHWSTTELAELVKPYIRGQYQVYARSREVFRGEIHSIEVLPTREVVVHFKWLATRGFTRNEFELKNARWRRIRRNPSGELSIRFHYWYYYYQKNKKIIKLKAFGEQCRFHLPDDPSNISKPDEE